jgi:hypothetical protein
MELSQRQRSLDADLAFRVFQRDPQGFNSLQIANLPQGKGSADADSIKFTAQSVYQRGNTGAVPCLGQHVNRLRADQWMCALDGLGKGGSGGGSDSDQELLCQRRQVRVPSLERFDQRGHGLGSKSDQFLGGAFPSVEISQLTDEFFCIGLKSTSEPVHAPILHPQGGENLTGSSHYVIVKAPSPISLFNEEAAAHEAFYSNVFHFVNYWNLAANWTKII